MFRIESVSLAYPPRYIGDHALPPSLQDGTAYCISTDTTKREGIDVTKLPDQRVERHRHHETSSVMKNLDMPTTRRGQKQQMRMRACQSSEYVLFERMVVRGGSGRQSLLVTFAVIERLGIVLGPRGYRCGRTLMYFLYRSAYQVELKRRPG